MLSEIEYFMIINKREYAAFYQTYIDLIDTSLSIERNMEDSFNELIGAFRMVPKEKRLLPYAENKWTLLQLIGHIIDTERIFTYRALRIARNDTKDLAGFDQDNYVANSDYEARSFDSLIEEFINIIASRKFLFYNLSEEELARIGSIDGHKMSVRAIGYISAGHSYHHAHIIKERYL